MGGDTPLRRPAESRPAVPGFAGPRRTGSNSLTSGRIAWPLLHPSRHAGESPGPNLGLLRRVNRCRPSHDGMCGVRPRAHRRQHQDAKPSSWTQGYLAAPMVECAADVSYAERRPCGVGSRADVGPSVPPVWPLNLGTLRSPPPSRSTATRAFATPRISRVPVDCDTRDTDAVTNSILKVGNCTESIFNSHLPLGP